MFQDTKVAFLSKNNAELTKAYNMFRLVENPLITKLSALFFSVPFGLNIPFVKRMIKKTVYQQFVGGENTNQCQQVANKLLNYNVFSILDYSVEGKTKEEDFDHTKNEILHLIKIAKNNQAFPFVVFKPTAFGKIDLYEKKGAKLKLTPTEQAQWQTIENRFLEVFNEAYKQNVTVMVDAEESWMQDAADELVLDMMRRFNKNNCIVCNTLQMYRHDRLDYLKKLYDLAKQENFLLGFKLVRGAYMEKERTRAAEKGHPSPIQPNKQATDRDYNLALEFIAQHTATISLFAGTHNEQSCELLTQLMQQHKINKNNDKIWFGQLYGMSDNISFILAKQSYNVAKYLPYGPIKEVMPYLIRRVQENTSVKGQSGRELNLIKQEIKRRKQQKQ